MPHTSRLGFKIGVAMFMSAIIPLLVSTHLVDQVVRVADSVAEGQTRSLSQPLERAADAYRELVKERKRNYGYRADLIARDEALWRALEGGDISGVRERLNSWRLGRKDLLQVCVGRSDETARVCTRRSESNDKEPLRDFSVERPIESASGWSVKTVFAAPVAPMNALRELGRAQGASAQIAKLRGELARYYRAAFFMMFGASVAMALGFSLIIARRTVSRVGVLLGATERVASGDLNTQVDLHTKDELGQLAESFNTMVVQLKETSERVAYLEKIEAWQEVARRLAHEIKNPLTPIQLALQQLRSKYQGGVDRSDRLLGDVVDIIGEEVGSLRRLVEDFSSFARLPSVQPEPVSVNTLVDDFLKSHAELSEQANVSWDPMVGDCKLRVDRMLIKHALFNVINNAIQISAEVDSERRPHVKIRAERVSGKCCVDLSVADDGPGMDEETAQRVFDPYFTRRSEGTGLGLAIVKKVILEHKGSVSVKSTPGNGATFHLLLPVADNAEPT